MKLPIFTDIENEEDVEKYLSLQDDCVLESELKLMAGLIVVALIMVLAGVVLIYTGW